MIKYNNTFAMLFISQQACDANYFRTLIIKHKQNKTNTL